MKKNTLMASVALTAGLAVGGVAGALLGVPGLSGAQDATTIQAQQPTPPPDGPGGRCLHGHRRGLEAAARALNMSVEDLRTQLRNGQTIAAVARSRGVNVQTVIDAMVADATHRIDQAVKDGKLTAEQAAQKKQGLAERITRMVNEGPPPRPGGPRAGRPPAD